MTDIVFVIKEVGFPIFISLYLIINYNKTLNCIKNSLNNQTGLLKDILEKIKGD